PGPGRTARGSARRCRLRSPAGGRHWPAARRPRPERRAETEGADQAVASSRGILALLLFKAKLAPQQFARVIGNFAQPLVQGLAPFAIERLRRPGRRDGFARSDGAAVGFRRVRRGGVGGAARLVFAGRGLAGRAVAGRFAARGLRRGLLRVVLALLLLLLAQQLLDAFAIVAGLIQERVTLQGQVVGLQRLLELAGPGQGAAPGVVIGGRVALGG